MVTILDKKEQPSKKRERNTIGKHTKIKEIGRRKVFVRIIERNERKGMERVRNDAREA